MQFCFLSVLNLNTIQAGLARQAFFGIYDGHGGVEAAKFVEAQLPLTIGSHPQFLENVSFYMLFFRSNYSQIPQRQPKEALVQAFQQTDANFLQKADREVVSQTSYDGT